jgi:hypothetical protein
MVEQMVHEYLQSTKQWAQNDYHLEFLRREGDPASPVVVLDAVHHDDLHARKRGGSKSVQLHVDLQSQRIVKELAYQ